MIKYIIFIVPFLLTIGCRHRGAELLHEYGYVVEKQFSPSTNAIGTTLTSGGHVGFTSVHEDEKYVVVFKCQHNVVSPVYNKDIYTELNNGDSVIISYYEILNNKNELKDFEFIYAIKK